MYKFLLRTPLKKIWKRIKLKKRAGVIFPLFSIFSEKSLGIGEIPDLKLAIDWCQKVGMTILQVLPLNDTGFDFSPYNSQSSFALDPIYLSLRDLTEIKPEGLEKELEDLTQKFSVKTRYVNYQIKKEKLKKLWLFFLERTNSSLKFKKFIKKNNYWLEDYSLFKVLKKIHKEKPWEDWEENLKNHKVKFLLEFRKKYHKQIEFQKWLQWQLFEQFKKIKNYARKKKIFLKGDLPLFVSRDSADVWQNRQYFKLNLVTGAPPDLFSTKGQRWGYPPYNWDEIFKDNFIYFRQRLKYAQKFYDLFRIDHLVGLFRIWSIPIETPLGKQGIVGFFDPEIEKFWEERGRKILKSVIKSTKMLPCAEDLGTVPGFCNKFLQELGIPGLDLQRWKKNWRNFQFLRPAEYRPISVATLSTHDLNNFPAWWEREAGGIPTELFKRKCQKKKIDFETIKGKLFSLKESKKERLFWKKGFNETKFIKILNRPKEKVSDLIKIFQETFREKEKFWKMIFLKGKVPKKAEKTLIKRNLELIHSSASIFVILPVFEWLFLGNILKGNPHRYRINKPGTISKFNWTLRMPISLENLLSHSINDQIREIIRKTKRA
jgi:4-alpha-glucanotransferase